MAGEREAMLREVVTTARYVRDLVNNAAHRPDGATASLTGDYVKVPTWYWERIVLALMSDRMAEALKALEDGAPATAASAAPR